MEKRPSHFRKWLGHFEETTKPFWKVAKSFLKVTCPFRLFPAKGRPCRRRDAATPPLSHLAFLVISLIAFDAGKFGSSKDSVEDVTTEDTETPSAARKAADEDCALRRKPPLILGTTKDGWNYFGWKVRRPLFGNRLPCRTKCGSVSSVVPAPTKIFEVQNLWDGSGYYGIILKSCQS